MRLRDDFSKVSSDDEIDIGRKLDRANLLLKGGFDNLNMGLTDVKTGLTDIKTGLNNLTTMMYEHNTRLEAILEKLTNK
ncbi:MAG: hypothetical protein O8C61_10730 [Candidatus Methanoperedens sp.]|nr:hypothetical protein [Candidatus Methanoperedens sp.]